MTQILQKGANISLTKIAPHCNEITIVVKSLKKANDETEFDIDASAFMLTENNKVRNDADFIFYNQSVSPDNAIELINSEEYNSQVFKVVLNHIAADINKVSINLTLHEAKRREQNFGMLETITIEVLDSNKTALASYTLDDSNQETALILADLYRYNGEWKFRAVGQGYEEGLEVLAKHYGVDIDSESTQAEIKPHIEEIEDRTQSAEKQDSTDLVQDDEQAASECRKAAEQGHAEAQVNLDSMYNNGQGNEESLAKNDGVDINSETTQMEYFAQAAFNKVAELNWDSQNRDDEFIYGEMLNHINQNELYKARHYESFKAYVEAECTFKYRKAMYLIDIYQSLTASGVSWSKVKHLGWTKIRHLAPVLTLENVDEWLGVVEGLNVAEVIALVEEHTDTEQPYLNKMEEQCEAVEKNVKEKNTGNPDFTSATGKKMTDTHNKNNAPTLGQVIILTVKALQQLNGRGSIEEIKNKVYEIAEISDDVCLDYTLELSRNYLDKQGLLVKNYTTGIWRLSKPNIDINHLNAKSIIYSVGEENIELMAKKDDEVSVKKTTNESVDSTIEQKTKKVDFAGKVHIADAESGIVLYKHQEQAFFNLQEKIIKSNKNPFAGLLVLPTGGGKTLTAAHWICKNYLDKGKKVLWIAHRHELLNQAKSTFSDKLAFNDIFENKKSFNYRIISGIHDRPINIKPTDDLIIAGKDSLTNTGFKHLHSKWIENNTNELFLVIDEAHHATAKTYRKLIENIQASVSYFQMLGLTATPIRTAENEQNALGAVFKDNIVYKIDLKQLITLGILSEPIFEEVATGVDFSEDFTDKEFEKMAQGFDTSSIGDRIAKDIVKNKERNEAVVNRYLSNKDKYKQTIVFALNVNNAIALNALFRERGINSDYIVSTVKDAVTGVTLSSKDNKAKIKKFRNEETQVLINVDILTEGTDIPNVQSVFLARPTVSKILMTQMIGRGLRGLKAGGTKEAYIVGFMDEWQNKINWENPEKIFIEDNFDFSNIDKETKDKFLRLIAINKIEEFAILTNKIIDPEKRKEIENISFIERFPVGVYQFKFLENSVIEEGDEIERNCEVLVYSNLVQSYTDFLNALPSLFEQNNLTETGILEQDELEELAEQIEEEFFKGTLKYPAYYLHDIKNILQYYATQGELPPYIELKDREKYDIDKIAHEIIDKDLGEKSQKAMIDEHWENDEISWQAFFGFDKRGFVREINSAKARINYPELHQRKNIKPAEEKELRPYEKLTLYELGEQDSAYAQWLKDEVFKKFTDKDGFYFSAESGYRSKNKLDFQIDHIKSMHNGGLTVLENLRLLTRSENAKKGSS